MDFGSNVEVAEGISGSGGVPSKVGEVIFIKDVVLCVGREEFL